MEARKILDSLDLIEHPQSKAAVTDIIAVYGALSSSRREMTITRGQMRWLLAALDASLSWLRALLEDKERKFIIEVRDRGERWQVEVHGPDIMTGDRRCYLKAAYADRAWAYTYASQLADLLGGLRFSAEVRGDDQRSAVEEAVFLDPED
jgi:hypothetical protein